MPQCRLSLDTLKDFDFGKASICFQQALALAVKDLMDRPGEKKPRTITLEVNLTPIAQQDGDVVDANVAFTIKQKLPAWCTAERPVILDRQGRLIFSVEAPDNPRQRTLGDTADVHDVEDEDE